MIDRKLLLQIAQIYGTPSYVYDLEDVRQRYLDLKDQLKGLNATIHYAVKANPHPKILHTLHELGAGVDCVSFQEVAHTLKFGFLPSEILYTPSCPSEEELTKAMELGVHVHIGALEYLPWIAKNYPGRPVGLRLNPGVYGGATPKTATAHKNSKFGIPAEQIDRLLEMVKKLSLQITGLHVHIGSDVESLNDLTAGVDFLTGLVPYFPDLQYLDFGSGFKVPYKPEEPAMDLTAYMDHVAQRMKNFPHLQVKFEPGKYLVARSGILLMRVNVVKRTPYKNFAGVNTGFNHMLRPMYYGAYHHIVNLSAPNAKPEKYDVVGNLCEEDTFARNRELPRLEPGHILALQNAGAYGFVMASHYNLRPLPQEIIVDGTRIYES